jgi:hypothetical protein
MADSFGIGATTLDYHSHDPADFEEFSVEYFRITQALLQAGVDIHMINPIDRARISAALWKDNTLFEEAGALQAMFYQSYGLIDSMHYTEEEQAKHQLLGTNIIQIKGDLEELEKRWDRLSPQQQEVIQRDWNARSKNIAVYFYELEELRAREATQPEFDRLHQKLEAANLPEIGQVNETYWLAREHYITKSLAERVVASDLADFKNVIVAATQFRLDNVVDTGRKATVAPPAGYSSWVEKVTAEREGIQNDQFGALGGQPVDPNASFAEKEEARAERRKALIEAGINPDELAASN